MDTPVASVIPLDGNFAARADAALRFWRLLTGQRYRPPDPLTRLQRLQLVLALRALDGHLAGATYREIAEVLFGTARVGEFLDKGFTFISVGNDLHHVLTQAGAYVNDVEKTAAEKGKPWKRRATALF
jgi:hypothetical protein